MVPYNLRFLQSLRNYTENDEIAFRENFARMQTMQASVDHMMDFLNSNSSIFTYAKRKKAVELEVKTKNPLVDTWKRSMQRSIPIQNLLDDNQKYDCTICLNSSCDTLLLPCGHDNVCHECAKRCEKCPLCYEVIERAIKYDS